MQGNMDIEKYPKEMIQAAQEYIKACKEEGLSEQQMLKILDELLEKQQPFCVVNTQYII
jgi:DNA-binding transcriptional regulator YhcF (GntR family)